MSCDVVKRGDLDAYVSGELGPAEARRVEAHLFGCSECAAELRRLRAEQRLFRVRAEQEVVAVPSFESVLARIDGAAAGKGDAREGAGRKAGAPARAGAAGKVGPAGRPAVAGKASGGGRPGVAGKVERGGDAGRAGWSSFLAPAGVAVAALAAAAASWMGVRQSPVESGPRPRAEVEDVAIGPERVCTSEAPVSDEPTASVAPAVREVKSEVVARGQEDSGVCGGGEVCGAGDGLAAVACGEAAVAWCSAGWP